MHNQLPIWDNRSSGMWHQVAVQIDTDILEVPDFFGIRTEWTLNVEGEFPPERWYTNFVRRMELRISPKNSTARHLSRYHRGFRSRQGTRGVFLLQQEQTSCGAHMTPCLLDTRIGFHWGKKADTYSWHLTPSSVEVKSECAIILLPQYAFIAEKEKILYIYTVILIVFDWRHPDVLRFNIKW